MALFTIPCILFAGGKSSRMGKDKALLPFKKHQNIVQYQYERLEKLFTHVYISAKDAGKFEDFDAVVIADELGKDVYAPTAGFVNVFRRLNRDNAIFVLSVDTPFVNESVIQKFFELEDAQSYDAIIARTPGGIHPLCGIYSRSLELTLVNMLNDGDHKLGKLLEASNVYYIDIEDEDALMNINTPEEYQKALQRTKADA